MGLGGAHCLPEPSVFESPRAHFRNRATFKVWKENTHDAAESLDEPTGGAPDLFFVMFNKDDELRMPLEVPHYPMGSKRLCALMPLVLNELRRSKELSEKVDYCSFMTTLAGPNDEALITLTYNRPLDDQAWSRAAQGMASALGAGIKVVGRSKHRKILVGGETLAETLHVPGRGKCVYTQAESGFTQPNAAVCQSMLGWAYEVTHPVAGDERANTDLCELYCGNGCFTVALAPNFRRVVAIECNKDSVALAEANLSANGVRNVKVARLSAEEFTLALEGARKFSRLDEAGLCDLLTAYNFSTLLVDPPRAGMDATCVALARRFARIVYISCNPETLARDLAALRRTHAVAQMGAFDQFPYTPHLEAGVLLVRREQVGAGGVGGLAPVETRYEAVEQLPQSAPSMLL